MELDDDSAEVVRRITIPIKAGLGWGQIPLTRKIFHEGGYTLRAYTNWMQNFGADAFFTQRFYLGVPSRNAWLANSIAAISRVADKNQLDVDIKLKSGQNQPVGLRNVEVKIYEGAYYLYKENMRTGIDGGLKFSKVLKDNVNGRLLRVQVKCLDIVDNGKTIQIPLAINRSQKIDLQFLPEGGNLVAGLQSTVGFKAIGEDGKGTTVTGAVYDNRGTKISDFTSLFKGMGSFAFTPKVGEVYTAKLSQPEAAVKSYPLPKVAPAGTVMHISNPLQGESITVNLSGMDQMTADSGCYIIGSSGGRVCYAEAVDSKQANLSIAKSLFPSGIARITLLKRKKPLNERVVFINHNDQLNIKIAANKTAYQKRDSVALEIEVKDADGMPVQGSFSIAVTDNTQVKPDTAGDHSMATNLLLNAGLKGVIETPGYYLNHNDNQAWTALDNLLLTQGWTGFDWKEVLTNPVETPKFTAEKEFQISGKVISAFKKPVPDAPVLISSQKPNFITTTIADANGNYTFKKLPAIDSGSFFLQARNSKGNKLSFGNISVNRFRAPEVPRLYEVTMPWYVNIEPEQLNYVAKLAAKANDDNVIAAGTLLRNVKVNSQKLIKGSWYATGFAKPVVAFDEEDIKESAVMNLYQLLRQKIPGFKVTNGGKFSDGMARCTIDSLPSYSVKILVDGPEPNFLPINIDDPTSVQELKDELSQFQAVVYKGVEMYISDRFEAITIGLTTKNGDGWYKNLAPDVTTYRPLPLLYPQQFYSPKYQANAAITGAPDYRPTVYWEPDVTTDISGKAKVFFYTSDLPKNYTINIQGMSNIGDIGGLVTRFPDGTKPVVQAPK